MGYILYNASLPSGVHVASVIGIRQRGMFSLALLCSLLFFLLTIC
jgi:hypothetical protein